MFEPIYRVERWMCQKGAEFVKAIPQPHSQYYDHDWPRPGQVWEPFVNEL